MPRIRSIKPQFWLDENLGAIPRDARLLYIGLWNLADDQGVFEWRPARIKVQLFPYDDDVTSKEIDGWLGLLLDTGDIARFEHDGHYFGYIKSFLEHQDIKNPSKWTFAPIPEELKVSFTPVMGKDSPSPTPVLPLGSREEGGGVGSRLKGKGVVEAATAGQDSENFFEQDPNLTAMILCYEKNISMVTPIIAEELKDLSANYPPEWFPAAVKEAVNSNGRNLKYIKSILGRWEVEGFQSPRKGTKKGKSSPGPPADPRLARYGGNRGSLMYLIAGKTKPGISKMSEEWTEEIKRLNSMATDELLKEARRIKL